MPHTFEKFCPNCGEKDHRIYAFYCSVCGTKLKQDEFPQETSMGQSEGDEK